MLLTGRQHVKDATYCSEVMADKTKDGQNRGSETRGSCIRVKPCAASVHEAHQPLGWYFQIITGSPNLSTTVQLDLLFHSQQSSGCLHSAEDPLCVISTWRQTTAIVAMSNKEKVDGLRWGLESDRRGRGEKEIRPARELWDVTTDIGANPKAVNFWNMVVKMPRWFSQTQAMIR